MESMSNSIALLFGVAVGGGLAIVSMLINFWIRAYIDKQIDELRNGLVGVAKDEIK